MPEGKLGGRTVMVTRPAAQSERLCRMIERAGGRALRFPVLEIVEMKGKPAARSRALLEDCGSYDALIFISRNAVIFAESLCPGLFARGTLPAIYATGSGTRRELGRYGIEAAAGKDGFGSEDLLRLESLDSRHVAGRRLMIVRGNGGRELLKNELQRRGARIDYAEVYQRGMPNAGADTLRKLWQDHRPDVIVITSVQSLDNLVALAGEENRLALLETPLAVMSPRIAEHAAGLGFLRPASIATAASDAALTAAAIKAAI